MDQILVELAKYSPLLITIYLLLRDVLPKVMPDLTKSLNKRTSLTDRLFKVIDDGNEVNRHTALVLAKLDQHLSILTEAMESIDDRVGTIETIYNTERKLREYYADLERRIGERYANASQGQ